MLGLVNILSVKWWCERIFTEFMFSAALCRVRGAEYSESSGSSSEEERPPAKRRKGEREKEVKLAKTNKRR